MEVKIEKKILDALGLQYLLTFACLLCGFMSHSTAVVMWGLVMILLI